MTSLEDLSAIEARAYLILDLVTMAMNSTEGAPIVQEPPLMPQFLLRVKRQLGWEQQGLATPQRLQELRFGRAYNVGQKRPDVAVQTDEDGMRAVVSALRPRQTMAYAQARQVTELSVSPSSHLPSATVCRWGLLVL